MQIGVPCKSGVRPAGAKPRLRAVVMRLFRVETAGVSDKLGIAVFSYPFRLDGAKGSPGVATTQRTWRWSRACVSMSTATRAHSSSRVSARMACRLGERTCITQASTSQCYRIAIVLRDHCWLPKKVIGQPRSTPWWCPCVRHLPFVSRSLLADEVLLCCC